MSMLTIMMGISVLVIILAFAAIVNAFIKKKPVGRWIALFAVTLLLPFIVTMTLGESRDHYNNADKGFQEPKVDENGVITFKKGEYIVGQHLDAGRYDAAVNDKFGEFSIVPKDYVVAVYGRLGLLGIKSFRLNLKDGDTLVVRDSGAILTPVELKLLPFEEADLTPGIYIIGEDITPGKYNISATTDTTGKVTIYDGMENRVVIEGSIGKGIEPPSADIELIEGDILRVLDINFKLIPINN